MKPASAPSALRFQEFLREKLGESVAVLEFDESTRTSEDAARAIGCSVAQIAKSLIFRSREGDAPVLVIASGVNRVDEKAAAREIGQKIGRADADFVRDKTGFAIGGVPPAGHAVAPITLIDEDLFAFAEIWAAGGTPNAVVRLTPAALEQLTGGRRAAIARKTVVK